MITVMITLGDPAGVGPEVAWKSVLARPLPADVRVVALGYPAHLAPHLPAGAKSPSFLPLSDLFSRPAAPGVFWASPPGDDLNSPIPLGRGSEVGARAAIRSIETAIDAATSGAADAICTAPISKESLKAVGFPYPGHTEMLAERSGARRFAMMLVGGGLRVALATIHEPLARVPSLISENQIFDLLDLVHSSMKDFDPRFAAAPARIGVCGLNPHAGEGGHIGREEIDLIDPAIRRAAAAGIRADGPHSADTLFHRACSGEFDAILAMYHDQGLIPVKTLDFHGGVNVTLGLPFVRTSPDHGAAYALAGRGEADPRSFLAALDLAIACARNRRRE